MIDPKIVCLSDYEHHAVKAFDAKALAYIQGGAEDELCLARNLAGWQSWNLLPRVLRSIQHGHTEVTLLGKKHECPILVAPVASHKLAHPDGELASSLAASALGVGYILSCQSNYLLEEVSQHLHQQIPNPAERAPLWFQLYLHYDRPSIRDLIQRAESEGYEALVITVDAPIHGIRNREQRAAFSLPQNPQNPRSPDHLEAVNLRNVKLRVSAQDANQVFGQHGMMANAPTWDEIEWLRGQTSLPILLKGILHPEDAVLALKSGVQGIVVSNHGGRTLDSLPSTAKMLPLIKEAIRSHQKPGTTFHLFVDGGIRRGSDVFKAIALGADAVLVGRPIMHALAVAGVSGVAHALKILKDELEINMALAGCATVEDITIDHIIKL